MSEGEKQQIAQEVRAMPEYQSLTTATQQHRMQTNQLKRKLNTIISDQYPHVRRGTFATKKTLTLEEYKGLVAQAYPDFTGLLSQLEATPKKESKRTSIGIQLREKVENALQDLDVSATMKAKIIGVSRGTYRTYEAKARRLNAN